jgi:hypothetical protein
MNRTIYYGIGKEYLPDWGVQEALREIYQNFMDFGKFKQSVKTIGDLSEVIITNEYVPKDLEFLQIGKSIKDGNVEAIGQHGEGLKMAMLVLLRLNYKIIVHTGNRTLTPFWAKQQLIGETFALKVTTREDSVPFTIYLALPKKDFQIFNGNLIKPKDVLFTAPYHGDIVDKPVGNLYVGRLFVCNVPNFKKSYNLLPSVLKLDRDRRIPSSFHTSWHTSKINEAQAKYDFKDQDLDDMKFVSSIPSSMYKDIKPKIIGNSLEFITKVDGKDTVIKNTDIKEHLKNQSYFTKALLNIKKFLLSKMGVVEMLQEFRKKYCFSIESKKDFDDILEKLGISIETGSDLPF